MSAVLCIHKYIRNCYIEIVTCICTQAVFDAVRNNMFDHKIFFYERDVNNAYIARTRKMRDRESTVTE